MTPTAQRPLPANDSRPARPVIYVTRASAESAAIRQAQRLSRSGTATPIEFVLGGFQPTGGPECFLVDPVPGPLGEYVVRELSALERIRLQQLGMRGAIRRHYEKAAEHDAIAIDVDSGRAVRKLHERMACEERAAARGIETRLTMGVVRAAEPATLAEVAS